jgi:uncharacterized protein YoxC
LTIDIRVLIELADMNSCSFLGGPMKHTQITIRINQPLLTGYQAKASQLNVSTSELLRKVLSDWMTGDNQQKDFLVRLNHLDRKLGGLSESMEDVKLQLDELTKGLADSLTQISKQVAAVGGVK